MQKLLLIALFLVTFTVCCSPANPNADPVPVTRTLATQITQLSETSRPEATATTSETLIPTITLTASPTNTPSATATALPTNTPTAVPATNTPTPIPRTNTPTPTPIFPADVFCQDVTEIPVGECEALVSIYNFTDGENWQYQDPRETSPYIAWLETKTPCSWIGITCMDNHVTEILLDGTGLRGGLPPEIENLSNLIVLNLEFNHLSHLPPEFGNLSNLVSLILWENNFRNLPPEIGDLHNLRHLDLGFNRLTTLPPEIGNLSNLSVLRLRDNSLRSIPPEIGNLTSLTWLDLYANKLSSIPLEIGNLPNLTELDLNWNNIESLPPELCASFRDDIELSPLYLCPPL